MTCASMVRHAFHGSGKEVRQQQWSLTTYRVHFLYAHCTFIPKGDPMHKLIGAAGVLSVLLMTTSPALAPRRRSRPSQLRPRRPRLRTVMRSTWSPRTSWMAK